MASSIPNYFNRHQPRRDRLPPGVDSPLWFATRPAQIDRYVVTEPKHMIAQMRLYRAIRRGEFVNHAPIEDLHSYIFYDSLDVSKRAMGMTLVRSVLYNPRRLKGVTKTNEKARMIYSFYDMREPQYGLEWMICVWLRKFLNETAAPGSDAISGPEAMEEELDILVNTEHDDYLGVYEQSIWNFAPEEPDWSRYVTEYPEMNEVKAISKPEPKPVRPELPKSLINPR